jgi:hypothetical protein
MAAALGVTLSTLRSHIERLLPRTGAESLEAIRANILRALAERR